MQLVTHLPTEQQSEQHRRLEQDSVFQVLLSSLPKHQSNLAMDFLAKISIEDLVLIKSRLAALSVERYCELAKQLGDNDLENLTGRRLLQYLKFFTLRARDPARPWDVKVCDRAVVSDEASRNQRAAVSEERALDCSSTPKEQVMCRLARLPGEIKDMILVKYFEAVFLPGEIEPGFILHVWGDHFFGNDYLYHHGEDLGRFFPELYEEYKGRYWRENTFVSVWGIWRKRTSAILTSSPQVFHAGQRGKQFELMHGLQYECQDNIRSIRLVLEVKDARYKRGGYYDDRYDLLSNLGDFRSNSQHNELHLLSTWLELAGLLFRLNLDSLVLDMRDSYSPNGGFLGMQFARLSRFRNGIPPHFEVLAPSSTMANGIRRVFEERSP